VELVEREREEVFLYFITTNLSSKRSDPF
jgi:hypothetical protein